jgi:hypothetical protein
VTMVSSSVVLTGFLERPSFGADPSCDCDIRRRGGQMPAAQTDGMPTRHRAVVAMRGHSCCASLRRLFLAQSQRCSLLDVACATGVISTGRRICCYRTVAADRL